MKVLVTGNAGFVGFHTAQRLLERGDTVVGFDLVDDYYDPRLKESRLAILAATASRTGSEYHFIRKNLADLKAVTDCFDQHSFDRVIHLAAQTGVRYSLVNPHAYVESNIIAFTNILEACRRARPAQLTYASSSSVYGLDTTMPFSEHSGANHPMQFYAATKRANELMAHAYSHLFRLPTTGLRFFTVYGPWGRPDMAYFQFTKAILEGASISLFNRGEHTRDFTYVDDVVEGIVRASDDVTHADPAWNGDSPDPATSSAPYRILNMGRGDPAPLGAFIDAIEAAIGKSAVRELMPLQPGDATSTFADVSELERRLGFRPSTPLSVGVPRFVEWYRKYYGV